MSERKSLAQTHKSARMGSTSYEVTAHARSSFVGATQAISGLDNEARMAMNALQGDASSRTEGDLYLIEEYLRVWLKDKLFFNQLDNDTWEAFAATAHLVKRPSGMIELHQGDVGKNLLFVHSGYVAMHLLESESAHLTQNNYISTMGPGHFISRAALSKDTKHSNSIITATTCCLLALDGKLARQFIQQAGWEADGQAEKDFISSVYPFNRLSECGRTSIREFLMPFKYSFQGVVCSIGDSHDFVYFVDKGSFRVEVQLPVGTTTSTAVVSLSDHSTRGELIGEEELPHKIRTKRETTVTCTSASGQLYALPAKVYMRVFTTRIFFGFQDYLALCADKTALRQNRIQQLIARQQANGKTDFRNMRTNSLGDLRKIEEVFKHVGAKEKHRQGGVNGLGAMVAARKLIEPQFKRPERERVRASATKVAAATTKPSMFHVRKKANCNCDHQLCRSCNSKGSQGSRGGATINSVFSKYAGPPRTLHASHSAPMLSSQRKLGTMMNYLRADWERGQDADDAGYLRKSGMTYKLNVRRRPKEYLRERPVMRFNPAPKRQERKISTAGRMLPPLAGVRAI